tara:strand:+ start:1759 stop:2457 length:699 start_codon:yes stop_codon:yes gene_type:complete
MVAPSLSPKLTSALEAFRAGGVSPTDEEIVWLASLRQKCDKESDGSVPWVMGAPVSYGGVDWYSLHRLAESWWLRSFKLLAGNQRDQVLVYIFAHAHSKPGDTTLRGLMGSQQISETVNAWAYDLAIHDDQLDELCDRLSVLDGNDENIPDPAAKPEESSDCVDGQQTFAGIMCKAFPGVSPEYWLTGIAANDARDMLCDVANDNFATSSERTDAIKNFLKAVKWIWVNHNG